MQTATFGYKRTAARSETLLARTDVFAWARRLNLALYLSPSRTSGPLIWGVGPAFIFDSATSEALGQGKVGVGGSAVALTIQGPWLAGLLVTQVASVGGDSHRKDVNQFLAEPFVNYNLSGGWYLTSSPIINVELASVHRPAVDGANRRWDRPNLSPRKAGDEYLYSGLR